MCVLVLACPCACACAHAWRAQLDSKRNTLIQVDLLTSFATFVTGLFTLIAGVFGMNLNSGLQEKPHVFNDVAIISAALVVTGFVVFVIAMRRLQLINLF